VYIQICQAIEKLLEELQDRFESEGHDLSEYGLPTPKHRKSDLDKEMLLYDEDEQKALAAHLRTTYPLNAEQQAIYDAAVAACESPTEENRYIMGAGVAGSGKTVLMNLLAAEFRSRGEIVKICASTTLAADLYKNGLTAHTLFNFPVEDDDAGDSDSPPECR
jgi:RecG-like helicase